MWDTADWVRLWLGSPDLGANPAVERAIKAPRNRSLRAPNASVGSFANSGIYQILDSWVSRSLSGFEIGRLILGFRPHSGPDLDRRYLRSERPDF